ncbi:MAG: ribosomal protein S18-alanine N-acetyltransferase [Oscillospiraceae bacterium]|jgi:ribosomal-protein-alanine N-acetyltransferase|nr:ribosomal protein S18-alanine N-acetyltransferase [Oscillospiraceae bacterium]
MAEILPLSFGHIEPIFEIETESFGDPWSKQSFAAIFASPHYMGFAAIDGAEVAGYLIARRMPPEIEILNIAVAKSKRRKKIATGLFCALFEYAKAEKTERLLLEVRRSNSAALGLYKKLGFGIDGFRKNYYSNPKEDAALMSVRI